jgi:hypothetical protein
MVGRLTAWILQNWQGFGLITIAVVVTSLAAWLTHVVWIIQTLASPVGATAGQIVLGLLGIFIPPIGALHGLIIWFT